MKNNRKLKARLLSSEKSDWKRTRKSAAVTLLVISSFSFFFGCSRSPNSIPPGNQYSGGGVQMLRQPGMKGDSTRRSTSSRSGYYGTNTTTSGSGSRYSTYYAPGHSSGSSSSSGSHSESPSVSSQHSTSGASHSVGSSSSHSGVSRGGFGGSSHSSSSS